MFSSFLIQEFPLPNQMLLRGGKGESYIKVRQGTTLKARGNIIKLIAAKLLYGGFELY